MNAVILWRMLPGPNPHVRFLHFTFYLVMSFLGPLPPVFQNQATTTTLNATFAKVNEDANQLIYRLQAGDTVGTIRIGECARESGICTVKGLTPGRKYLLSVQACISADSTICGALSTETTSYTIPRSEC